MTKYWFPVGSKKSKLLNWLKFPCAALVLSALRLFSRWLCAMLRRTIIIDTSTNGPITAANAAPELMPNTDTVTAIANSKLLEAAVNASMVVWESSVNFQRRAWGPVRENHSRAGKDLARLVLGVPGTGAKTHYLEIANTLHNINIMGYDQAPE